MKLILVGHSWGGGAAIDLANKLQVDGALSCPVDVSLITIDAMREGDYSGSGISTNSPYLKGSGKGGIVISHINFFQDNGTGIKGHGMPDADNRHIKGLPNPSAHQDIDDHVIPEVSKIILGLLN